VANRINARRRAPGGRPHLSAPILPAKVDRLSRSLTDFARIVEIFERYNASFVSITQQFNTTTSMGRLTLNVLVSFGSSSAR
jgi:Resolvase, N terminal domain